MDRKEQEVLAVLGLIVSVLLLGWTIYSLRIKSQPVQQAQRQVEEPKKGDVQDYKNRAYTKEELQLLEVASEYGNQVVESLVIRPNYDYIYRLFEEKTKAQFDYDASAFSKKLAEIFGTHGFAENVRLNNQNLTYMKGDWTKVVNRYAVKCDPDRSDITYRLLEVYFRVQDDKFTLYRLVYDPM